MEELNNVKGKKKGVIERLKGMKLIWKIIIIAVLVLALTALILVWQFYWIPLQGGQHLFPVDTVSPITTPQNTQTDAWQGGQEPSYIPGTPAPTVNPWDVIYAGADLSMMKNIVNVLIIGVDYSEERVGDDWTGKQDFHSDVMMIVAINFDEKTVDLISLPRDTYASIPGIEGIYKLNAAINCGGGYNEAGFEKVCEAAEWMLGGIPVDYYYAVNMPTVKALADAIGGVDYDVEVPFEIAGRKYEQGMQHLDGQGVLDYLRVRKGLPAAHEGDLNRINRQKKMLIALFNKMKQESLLHLIPELVQAFSDNLYTNCDLRQTMTLALFAYDLEVENIGMHSMDGRMKNIFHWGFCITDQEKRVRIIKEVYNVDAPEYIHYTMDYAENYWARLQGGYYLEMLSEGIDKKIDEYYTAFERQTPGEGEEYAPVNGVDYEEFMELYAAYQQAFTDVEAAMVEAERQAQIYDENDGAVSTALPELTPTPTPTFTPTPVPTPTPDGTDSPIATFGPKPSIGGSETMAPMPTDTPQPTPTLTPSPTPSPTPLRPPYYAATYNLMDCNERLKQAALAMAKLIGYRLYDSSFTFSYWSDPEFNEVEVDFR